MKCPQCGTEFDAPIEQCFICGWDFNEDKAEFTPRTSKLAVFAMMLGILCLVTLYLSLLPAVVLSIIALRKIRISRGRLAGERIAMAAILIPVLSFPVFLALGYAVWSRDAGPVPNEFTEADLVNVRPENRESWNILLKLCDNRNGSDEISAIGLMSEDQKEIRILDDEILKQLDSPEKVIVKISENKEKILYLWEKTKNARVIIQQLSEYDEIADLSTYGLEPYPQFCMNLVALNKIDCLYILSTMQENNREALNGFLEMNRISQSYGIYARELISKMASLLMMLQSTETMNYLVNFGDLSATELYEIANHFRPLSEQHVSLKNPIIYEYLMLKNAESEILDKIRFNHPGIKYNSMMRYKYCYCKNLLLKDEGKPYATICEISVWPWEAPNWPEMHFFDDTAEKQFQGHSLYFYYNPIGCLLLSLDNKDIFTDRRSEQKAMVLIKDDLFQWVLARRMGQEGSLTARAYSDQYSVDVEKGLVFSVGPDGVAYTEDDIKLWIDPVMLGLK